jgi:hypothetical protein
MVQRLNGAAQDAPVTAIGFDSRKLAGVHQFLNGCARQPQNLGRFTNANKVHSHLFPY